MLVSHKCVWLFYVFGNTFAQLTIHTEDNKRMSYIPPILTEEEMRSWNIPGEKLKNFYNESLAFCLFTKDRLTFVFDFLTHPH